MKRLAPGEAVLVGDGLGRVVEGVVAEVVGRDRVDVRVSSYAEVAQPSPRLVVVQALAKGERSDLSVELLTEVGVDVVVPWSASRSVAQWRGEKAARGVEKWAVTAREAAKQARRARVLDVLALASTADVVDRVHHSALALVLHESAGRRLVDQEIPSRGDVVPRGRPGRRSVRPRARGAGWRRWCAGAAGSHRAEDVHGRCGRGGPGGGARGPVVLSGPAQRRSRSRSRA